MLKAKLTHRETQVRFARFLIVGATAYVVQVVTIKVCLQWLEVNAAFTLSFITGTLVHYALNRFWALPSVRTDTWRQFREYLFAAALSYLISLGVFHLCFDVIGLGKVWATAVAVPPSTVVVFLLLNFRVFRASNAQTRT